jgi:hypothetical protein
VVEQAPALIEPGRFVLLSLPADPDPRSARPCERTSRVASYGERPAAAAPQGGCRYRVEPGPSVRDDGEDGQRLQPVMSGRWAGARPRLPALRPAVGLEVLAEHDVIRDDDPVDARQVGGQARSKTWSQVPGSCGEGRQEDRETWSWANHPDALALNTGRFGEREQCAILGSANPP